VFVKEHPTFLLLPEIVGTATIPTQPGDDKHTTRQQMKESKTKPRGQKEI